MNTICRVAAVLGCLCCGTIAFGQLEIDFEDSPLDDIAHEMKVSSSQLSKRVTAKPTQDPQQKAVDKLDALIAKLEEERQRLAGSGQSTANPTMPANASTILTGPGGSGDLQAARDGDDRWGDLPDHERDRILQSLTEGFPAHYQSILEAYYKRLATEKPIDETDAPLETPRTKKSGEMPKKSMPAAPSKSKASTKKSDR